MEYMKRSLCDRRTGSYNIHLKSTIHDTIEKMHIIVVENKKKRREWERKKNENMFFL